MDLHHPIRDPLSAHAARNSSGTRSSDSSISPSRQTASWSTTWLTAYAGTIYAGTSEVQRNILAETALGLPKEKK